MSLSQIAFILERCKKGILSPESSVKIFMMQDWLMSLITSGHWPLVLRNKVLIFESCSNIPVLQYFHNEGNKHITEDHDPTKKAMKLQNVLISVFSLFLFLCGLQSYVYWWLMEVLKGRPMCISFSPAIVGKLGKDGDRWDLYMGRQFLFKSICKMSLKKVLRSNWKIKHKIIY